MSTALRDIRLFVAAFEERSFTAAAVREGATQSGVSQHIKRLEDKHRVKLFLREKGVIVPTPAGERFYHGCIATLRAAHRASDALRGFAEGLNGELVVGVMPTMAQAALAPVLETFSERHPNIALHVVDGFSAALTHKVQADEVDFAIVPSFPGVPGVRSRKLMETPEVLISSPASAYRHGVPVRLTDLPALKLVLPGHANVRRRMIEAYCTDNGIELQRTLDLDSILATCDLVRRTDWVTIQPSIAVPYDATAGLFNVSPIVDPVMDLELVLIEPARRPLSAPALAFLSLLEDSARAISTRWQQVRDRSPLPGSAPAARNGASRRCEMVRE
jgi:DNA-binding transcriptional LysR family regulator